MRKASAVAALRAQRTATLGTLSALPDDRWDAPCLPRWRVRDVVAHLVSLDEAAVTGRLLSPLRRATDRGEWEHWNDIGVARWRDRPPPELRAALARWGARLAGVVNRLPAAAGRVPFRSWLGRHPLLLLVYRRVLDEWVHQQDLERIVRPGMVVGLDDVPPGVPDVIALAVLQPMPQLALPRVTRTAGVARLVVDTGGDHRRTWAVDFARRQYGARVTTPADAVIRLDAMTLALIAEGRDPWRALPAERLLVEGDDAVAADLLDALPPPPRHARPGNR